MIRRQRQQVDPLEGYDLAGLERTNAAKPGVPPAAFCALRQEERGIRKALVECRKGSLIEMVEVIVGYENDVDGWQLADN